MRPCPLPLKPLLALALLPALLALAACDRGDNIGQTEDGRLVLGNAEAEEAVQRGVWLGERTLVFEGFSGAIELTGTSSEEARLTFTKHARGGDQEEAREVLRDIAIEERGDGATYRYTISSDQPEVSSVDVRGSVPEGTNLRIQMEDGTVALSAIEGPIRISGQSLESVRIGGAARSVDVETRNGTIELGMERLPDTSQVRLRTTNGDLLLALPAAAAADVEVQTAAGEIEVDGLQFEDRDLQPEGAGSRFRGQLGQSGADVRLQTENGTVLLREGAVPTLAALGTFPRNVASIDPAPDTLGGVTFPDSLAASTDTLASSALPLTDSLAIPTGGVVDTTVVGVVAAQMRPATEDTATAAPDTVLVVPDTTTAAAPAPTPAQTTIAIPLVPTDTTAAAPDTVAAPDTSAATPDTTAATLDTTAVAPDTTAQAMIVVPVVPPTSEDTSAGRPSAASVRRVAGSVDSLSAVTSRLSALTDSIAASVDSLSTTVDPDSVIVDQEP